MFSSRAIALGNKALFAIVFTLVPLGVFVAFSLFHDNKPNWTGPLWLAILPFVAAALAEREEGGAWLVRRLREVWLPTIGITIIVFAALFHYVALGLPGVGYRHNIRTLPVAWDEFGLTVAGIEKAVSSQSDKSVVLIGMDKYFLASEMAFYARPDGPGRLDSIGRSAIGGGSLMYDIWFPPKISDGKTALMISLNRPELEKDQLANRFSRMTDIREQIVRKRGAVIGSFYYRVGYDLRSCCLTDATCGAPAHE
jgi:dolichol-phosphate mannosyltransferase